VIHAKTSWAHGDQYIGSAGSGHAIVVDVSQEKIANSPIELVLIGLCGCTGSDVVSILKKKREPFTSLEVRAEADRAAEPPTVFTAIRLVYRVGGKVAIPQWNMRFIFPKTNTARFLPCLRKPLRSPSRSNMLTNK